MIQEILNEALSLGACDLARKPSNWREMVDLFFSPQGIEFCIEQGYPTLEMWRKMPKDVLEDLGVYVDAGNIEINDRYFLAVVGDTCADIICNKNQKVYRIIGMHGARAKINANDYSVARICQDGSCSFDVDNDETAIVLK